MPMKSSGVQKEQVGPSTPLKGTGIHFLWLYFYFLGSVIY